MHRVRTGDGLLEKKVRTGSVDAITGVVYPDLRSPATVSFFTSNFGVAAYCPLQAWQTLGKMHPLCSSSPTILPRKSVVTREHHEYSSEVIEHGAKKRTQDSPTKGQDFPGGKRRQNRAVPFGQGSPAA